MEFSGFCFLRLLNVGEVGVLGGFILKYVNHENYGSKVYFLENRPNWVGVKLANHPPI